MRILYSFPYPLGAAGVGTTAYQHVAGLAGLSHDVLVSTMSLTRPLPKSVEVHTTLMVGDRRLRHGARGMRPAMELHDRVTARRLVRMTPRPDLVHTWSGVTLHTARAAHALGIPVVRECQNTHTANAIAVAEREAERVGVTLPENSPHRGARGRIEREEREYQSADAILVPSEAVRLTFLERGYSPDVLLLHQYGYDRSRAPERQPIRPSEPFTVAFVGRGEPRKGLHLALQAWFDSGAYRHGRFLIAGDLYPEYEQVVSHWLAHPSVHALGFVDDVGQVLGQAHALVLPSLEEGSALVTYEAQGWGCAVVVSDATGARCTDGVTGLVHRAGDIAELTAHLRALSDNPDLVDRLRAGAWASRDALTWDAAARVLQGAYEAALSLQGTHREEHS